MWQELILSESEHFQGIQLGDDTDQRIASNNGIRIEVIGGE
jgi:hypothetical protein